MHTFFVHLVIADNFLSFVPSFYFLQHSCNSVRIFVSFSSLVYGIATVSDSAVACRVQLAVVRVCVCACVRVCVCVCVCVCGALVNVFAFFFCRRCSPMFFSSFSIFLFFFYCFFFYFSLFFFLFLHRYIDPCNLFDGARRHDYHHSHNMGCYGDWFPFWDHACGTDRNYRTYLAQKVQMEGKAK